MATTPQQHFNHAKKLEAFVLDLISKQDLGKTLKIGLWPNATDYNRSVVLVCESNLDPDLQQDLQQAIKHILSTQITRSIGRQYSAAAIIEASAKEAKAEINKADFTQKTIFDISESASQYLNNYPELKK